MVNSVTNISQGFPTIQAPLVNDDKTINQIWLQLLITLWNRTGMGQGVSTADAIAFATLTENRLALPLPNIDTDLAVSSVLSIQPPSGGAGASGLEGDLVITPPQHFDDLASALFFPTPPAASAAASASITVEDEGIVLTAAVTSFNFVGAAIIATAVGNDVTVTSNGMLPLVNGDLPGPAFITDGSGQCIGVPL
jgi:hypothetical protein